MERSVAKISRGAFGALVCLLIFVSPLSADPAKALSGEEARTFLETIYARALKLEASSAGLEPIAYQQALRDLVCSSLDVDAISRFAAGAGLAKASDAERAEYRTLYVAWMMDIYQRYFLKAMGGRLNVAGSEAVPGTGDVYVKVALPGLFMPIYIDARVRRGQEGLGIVDLSSSGVSLIKTQRDDFTAVIERRGFEGLLMELRRRVNVVTADVR
jgi:phospholipid transport system substrate-binding protein